MNIVSYIFSILRLAKPPQRCELPRTKGRFERMEPSKDNLQHLLCFDEVLIMIWSSQLHFQKLNSEIMLAIIFCLHGSNQAYIW